MQLIFADEFGDFAFPKNGLRHPSTRPILGYGGIIIPSNHYKALAESFYRMRMIVDRNILFAKMPGKAMLTAMYQKDRIAAAMRFELKGRDVFSTSYITRDKKGDAEKKENVFQYARWFLRDLAVHEAKIIYAGVRKDIHFSRLNRDKRGFRRSLHVEQVRGLLNVAHRVAAAKRSQVKLIFDHHPKDDETYARVDARNKKVQVQDIPELQTRREYCREVILEKSYFDYIKEPMFHIESEWSAGVQIADWVCTLLTKVKSFEVDQAEYGMFKRFHEKLGVQIDDMTIEHSEIRFHAKPPEPQLRLF